MICTGWSNCSQKSGGQVGVAVDHGVHRIAQAVRVERAGDGDVELHRIHVVGVVLRVLAWKSSPCCKGVSGKISAIRYCCCSSSI